MNEPIRILSDLHLGHKVSRIARVAALRQVIAGAGTMVFNGDTWQELAGSCRGQSAAMLDELKALCADEGAAAVFLAGNHDPGWSGCGWLELAGGRIVVTHGDALLFDGSPWKREILRNGGQVRELWKQHPTAGHDPGERLRLAREMARTLCSVEHPRGRHFVQRAWDAIIPPQRALKMIRAWWCQPALGDRFCEQYFPHAGALVIGHFHRAGWWVKNHRVIINTGSFVSPGHACWAQWQDGRLSCGKIDESRESYRMGRPTGSWLF